MGNNSPILANGILNFQITPSDYCHWRVEYDEDIATIYMEVTETAGLYEDYELKLNSYDFSYFYYLYLRISQFPYRGL